MTYYLVELTIFTKLISLVQCQFHMSSYLNIVYTVYIQDSGCLIDIVQVQGEVSERSVKYFIVKNNQLINK